MKKKLGLFLSICLIFNIIFIYGAPVAFAVSGTGISTLDQLRTQVDNGTTVDVYLTQDITVSDYIPIGTAAKPFKGTLNGNGHTITISSFSSSAPKLNMGLIGYAQNAKISNVGVIITAMNGTANLGGVVGYLDGGSIANSYCTAVSISSTGDNIGGIVGLLNGSVYNCYAKVNKANSATFLAGIAGNVSATSSVASCYSGSSGTLLYGIATNNSGSITNCYYQEGLRGVGNKDATDVDNTANTLKKTANELKCSVNFSGLNFTTDWGYSSSLNDGYPVLKAFYPNANEIQGLSVFGGGNGTLASPYLVSTEQQLAAMRTVTNGYFRLSGNITLTGAFTPIGTAEKPFTGGLDGNSFTISGLSVNSSSDYAGLFGYTSGATIENLGIINPNVIGVKFVGGLVGYAEGKMNLSTISNCYVSGGSVKGQQFVGGLAGSSSGAKAVIRNSYSTAAVEATITGAGGLLGVNNGDLYSSYSNGTVTSPGTGIRGAVIGISNELGNAVSCYYDTATNTVGIGYLLGTGNKTADSAANIIQTIAQKTDKLKFSSTYTDWNFTSVWGFVSGASFPSLRSFGGTFVASNQTYFTPVDGKISISTANQLSMISLYPQGSYLLTGNIDLAGAEFAPIGTLENPFTGIFDGAGYTISNFKISKSTKTNVGLFAVNSGIIKNLKVSGATVEGYENVGALVGISSGGIESCSVASSSVTGTKSVGGLAGKSGGQFISPNTNVETSSYVLKSASSATVVGKQMVGGLLGVLKCGSLVLSSSTANVTGSSIDKDTRSFAGGLVGYAYGSTIKRSFARATVTGTMMVGGLIGQSDTSNILESYAASNITATTSVGGFAGHVIATNTTAIKNCYYDSTLYATDKSGATGMSTASMKVLTNFKEWTTAAWTSSGSYLELNAAYTENPSDPVVIGSPLGKVDSSGTVVTNPDNPTGGTGGGAGSTASGSLSKPSALVDLIKGSNTTITAKMENGSTAVPFDVLSALSQNVGKTLVVESDAYKWEISAIDSAKLKSGASYDMGTTISKPSASVNVPGINSGSVALSISINHDGDLPGTFTLKFNASSSYSGKTLYLYMLNESTGKYAYQSKAVAGSTGAVALAFTHASEYILTDKMILTDIEGHWANSYIMSMVNLGVVSGNTQGLFEPDKSATRAEFSKMVAVAFGYTATKTLSEFSDVKQSDWYYTYVAALYEKGIIKGVGNGSFGADDTLSREQMATIIYRVLADKGYTIANTKTSVSFSDASKISDYAKEAVNSLALKQIVNGITETEFSPQASASKAQVATIIYRILNAVKKA